MLANQKPTRRFRKKSTLNKLVQRFGVEVSKQRLAGTPATLLCNHSMLTGDIRNKIDQIWNAFWSGGISNPLEVIEQITYLLFLRRLDELQTLAESKAARTGKPIEHPIFPRGKDPKGRPYQDLRWSRLKQLEAKEMYTVVAEHVFPFLRTLGGDDSTYAHHMKDARFTIPKPELLVKVVDMLDEIPMEDRDTKGDLYEYMLGKIATAGQNGQFRTPRHIIQLMVELTKPGPKDVICDPACGTAGFLVAAAEYVRKHHPAMLRDPKGSQHFHHEMFHGYDFDSTMLRIGSMNMLLHGVENPDIRYRDSLAQDHAGEEEKYTLVLANPPFAGSLDYESVAKDLLGVVKTKKTELLFLALFTRLLTAGGRAAVIVPAGVLESESAAHEAARRLLVEDMRLEGVIMLPHWIFKPYASVATAILLFGKGGKTSSVWYYRLENDGFSNDAAKTPRAGSEIPELLKLWNERTNESFTSDRGKHRFVSLQEIRDNRYDLCGRVYLSGYEYPPAVPLVNIGDLFDIKVGTVGAANATEHGEYPFVTSSQLVKRYDDWGFDAEAICIPTVSSTGHGHASIKHIHYVNGKFAAATIIAVLIPKPNANVHVPYVYYYLLVHKDELLVPLMRGAANVSLAPDRLARLKIPVPASIDEQRNRVANVSSADHGLRVAQHELTCAKHRLTSVLSQLRESY